MHLKLVILILAAVTLQGQASVGHPASLNIERGLIENIQNALSNLIEKVQSAVIAAIEKISQLLTKILELANRLVVEVISKATQVVEAALSGISELIERAADLGVDVTECTNDHMDELKALPELFAKRAKKCIKTQTDEARVVIGDAIEELQSIVEDVTGLATDLVDCGLNISCLINVSGKITAAAIKLPVRIASKVTEIIRFAATIQVDLTVCGTSAVVDVTKETSRIVGVITKCIKDKIDEDAANKLIY